MNLCILVLQAGNDEFHASSCMVNSMCTRRPGCADNPNGLGVKWEVVISTMYVGVPGFLVTHAEEEVECCHQAQSAWKALVKKKIWAYLWRVNSARGNAGKVKVSRVQEFLALRLAQVSHGGGVPEFLNYCKSAQVNERKLDAPEKYLYQGR